MKYNLNRNELIEAYLKGELSETNTKEFEILMEKDHRLKTEVDQFKQLFDGFERLREREQLKKYFKKWDAKIDRKKKPKNWIYSAVAILMLACCFYFNSSSKDNNALFAAYYQPYPNVIKPITRGGTKSDSQIDKMMFLYESQQYNTLIPMLKSKNENAQWNFYLGIAYLASDDTNEALKCFHRIKKGDNFYHQKLWYTALSYLKIDQEEDCIALLKEIIAQETYQHKNAVLLLEEIQ